MAICQTCGNENRDGARFCRYCGQLLEQLPVADASSVADAEPAPADLPEIPFADEAELFADMDGAQAVPEPASEQAEIPAVNPLESGEESALQDHEQPEEQPAITIPEAAALLLAENPSPPAEDERQADVETELPEGIEDTEPEESFDAQLIGTVLSRRYRVLSVVSATTESQVFEVEDLLRCWSCDALQADLDEQYCSVCGAAQTHKPRLWLRQYGIDDMPETAEECFREAGKVYCLETVPEPETPDTMLTPATRLVIGYHTDAGLEREINEDSLLVLLLAGICESQSSPTMGFFAVADGIGGNEAGEIASRTAVHCLATAVMEHILLPAVSSQEQPDTLPEQLVKDAVSRANQEIIRLRSQTQREINMGCTLTAALVWETQAVVINVGDSRTYRLRQGHLEQITRDHSIVARLVEQGYISKEEIYTHDQKSVIYRSLGDRPDVEIDTFPLELLPGDRLLLCSDGLWEMVRDPLIEEVLLERYDPQQACDRLVELANLSGGEDNISVVVINIDAFA